MKIDENLRYTKTHEWVRVEGKQAVCGITDYAQEQLTDIVYVELPEEGDQVVREHEIGVVESCKTAADLYAPVTGKVTAVNEKLANNPEWVNEDPYGNGWMMKIEMANPPEVDALMDSKAYEAHIASEQE